MTRGNQREMDRVKAQKKAAASKSKPKESNTTLAKRKESDAEALRAKQKVNENTPHKEDSCLMRAFRKRKKREQPPPQVVNSIHTTWITQYQGRSGINRFVQRCSGMWWRMLTVPIGTPLEALHILIEFSVPSVRAACELEFGTGVDVVKAPTKMI
ncbi:hypothetical protein EDB89DRAFT_1608012 [Lactarius sanguifluus]|nr:hypothetical protein EDB89DRAFT_1608012 [Lactarius sanguifluus]